MSLIADFGTMDAMKDTVVTIGTFDGVHLGHRVILEEVTRHAREAEAESVLITFEPHPRKLLNPATPVRLLTPLPQKLELIRDAGIDHIVVTPFTQAFAQMDALEYVRDFLVKRFKPRRIVIGYDHHFGKNRNGNIELLRELQEQMGFRVFEIPAQLIRDAAVSSTKIRQAISAGEVSGAAAMLGRPFSVSGTVVHGHRRGREIGYPTANIEPGCSEQLLPATGIYAVAVRVGDALHKGMLSIGYNPTVTDEGILRIEVHIFDFAGDLYGSVLTLLFLERLRDELHFGSMEELILQMRQDEQQARMVPFP